MASRKLDYVVEKLEEQNRKDEKQLLKENHISKRFVDVLNKNRENLHLKTEFRELRFTDGLIRNELLRLDKVNSTKEQRRNTVDTKMNTYRSQNFLLNPKNKKNIFNYIDNLNYVLDKHNKYRYDYHKSMLDNMNFYNFNKDRYFAHIHDKFYNNNNDKRWMSNNVLFHLNRAVNDEVKEDKDFKEANKLNRYNTYLKNKRYDNLCYSQNLTNKHIDAKTKYNDFFLDKDDLLIKRVNDIREGKIINNDDQDYYHKIVIDKDELDRRHKTEAIIKKKREDNFKMLEEERRKKVQDILEKESLNFKIGNKKDYDCLMNHKKAQIDTVKEKEDEENKYKEIKLRNERIYKNDTVYKKGMYEMPTTNFL